MKTVTIKLTNRQYRVAEDTLQRKYHTDSKLQWLIEAIVAKTVADQLKIESDLVISKL